MIRLRRQARKDIRNIVADLEDRSASPSIRHRFYAAFEESCLLYEQWPLIAPLVDFGEARQNTLRRFTIRRFPKYLVFYRAEPNGILIERVVYGARDLPLLLNARRPD